MYATTIRHGRGIAIAATLMILGAQQVYAATAEEQCEGGKNDAAGKYSACVAKATKSLVTLGDVTKYNAAVAKCESKLVGSWNKLEAAAVAAGTTCPSTGDQSDVEDFVDACLASVADAVSGGTLPSDVVTCNGDLDTCNSDLDSCEDDLATSDSDLSGCEDDLSDCQDIPGGGLPKTGQTTCYDSAGSTISCTGTKQDGEQKAGVAISYTNNGNGTITDNVTGLMWEKLSDDGSIHDKDNTYAGLTAAVAKTTSLNTANFAGHNDWRVPNIRELASITDMGRGNPAINPIFNTGCVASCTVLTCSCTKNFVYTSSTTYLEYTPANWKVNFADGDIYAGDRTDTYSVRAVRTAN